jgi:hypothetical protein
MCEDKKAEGLNERMAAKADQEQQILQARLVELRALIPPFPTGRAFVHTSDLDHNGVLWFLGTGGLTHAWANPCEAGLVKVSTSGIMEDSAPLSAVCSIFYLFPCPFLLFIIHLLHTFTHIRRRWGGRWCDA